MIIKRLKNNKKDSIFLAALIVVSIIGIAISAQFSIEVQFATQSILICFAIVGILFDRKITIFRTIIILFSILVTLFLVITGMLVANEISQDSFYGILKDKKIYGISGTIMGAFVLVIVVMYFFKKEYLKNRVFKKEDFYYILFEIVASIILIFVSSLEVGTYVHNMKVLFVLLIVLYIAIACLIFWVKTSKFGKTLINKNRDLNEEIMLNKVIK